MLSPRQEELVASHLNLVRSIAGKLHRKFGGVLEYDELVSAGTIGLMQAARRYDPSTGNAFSTYAFHRIRGATCDAIRGLLPAPLESEEISEEQNVSHDPSPIESLIDAEMHGKLRAALRHLPPRSRKLVLAHYFGERTLQDAGADLGVSKSWASRLHAQALRILRDSLSPELGCSACAT